jgi:hypothetical protein
MAFYSAAEHNARRGALGAVGDSRDEVEQLGRAAIALRLEGLRAAGLWSRTAQRRRRRRGVTPQSSPSRARLPPCRLSRKATLANR